ncbi:MAG: hypothetical protein DMD33_00935 [Gemmatimonadetes bacterium]|nr:MAG: hypothetical protein DMD33_00935 [Gemmatimonadota bacterium]
MLRVSVSLMAMMLGAVGAGATTLPPSGYTANVFCPPWPGKMTLRCTATIRLTRMSSADPAFGAVTATDCAYDEPAHISTAGTFWAQAVCEPEVGADGKTYWPSCEGGERVDPQIGPRGTIGCTFPPAFYGRTP